MIKKYNDSYLPSTSPALSVSNSIGCCPNITTAKEHTHQQNCDNNCITSSLRHHHLNNKISSMERIILKGKIELRMEDNLNLQKCVFYRVFATNFFVVFRDQSPNMTMKVTIRVSELIKNGDSYIVFLLFKKEINYRIRKRSVYVVAYYIMTSLF